MNAVSHWCFVGVVDIETEIGQLLHKHEKQPLAKVFAKKSE